MKKKKPKNSSEPSIFRLRGKSGQAGSILILVLWSLCLLSSFALCLGYSVREKLMLVEKLDGKNKLYYLLEAGITKAIAQIKLLKKDSSRTHTALNETWSSHADIFRSAALGDGEFNVFYNYFDESSGVLMARYGLMDEESKININKCDRVVLQRLFQVLFGFDKTEAGALSASIVDWRDSDSELSIPVGSAENNYYSNLGYPYGAKNADFQILEELLLVRGMTPEIFSRIENYVTIYGDGRVNINTTSRVVLLALGMSEDIVDKVMFFRKGEDKVAGTADDNIFDLSAHVVPKLSQFYDLSVSEIAQISAVADLSLSTFSDNFMIKASAHLNNKKYTAAAVSIANRQGEILRWREV